MVTIIKSTTIRGSFSLPKTILLPDLSQHIINNICPNIEIWVLLRISADGSNVFWNFAAIFEY